MEFSIPSRGLIGLRSQLMTDTRGTALIHSLLEGWTEYAGDMAMRLTGALVSDRAGVSTAYAIWASRNVAKCSWDRRSKCTKE